MERDRSEAHRASETSWHRGRHRESDGKDYTDPTFAKWARAVVDAGLLLGVYHFGSNTAPGDVEARYYLDRVGAILAPLGRGIEHVRHCLDFEPNPEPKLTMTAEQARSFVHYVRAETGRAPLLYGSTSWLAKWFPDPHDPISVCPLWPAAYGPKAPALPPAWDRFELFQYTDGKLGPADQVAFPRATAGLGDVDRSAYAGTVSELRAGWLS